MFAARFKLRLYQHYNLTSPIRMKRRGDHSGKDQRRGDERNVDGDKIHRLAECRVCEIPGIRLFEQSDSRILAQLEIHLAVACVDGDHSRGAVLEEAIGKTSGGGAHIDAGSAIYIDVPVLQRTFEFQPAATHILQILSEQADRGGFVNLRAGLFDLLFVNEYFAGENQRLRSLA